jgi:hypothetical protein
MSQPPNGRAGVLAIDAGNSKTDVALISTDGRVMATARGGPFLPHRIGADAAVAGLVPIVDAACADAGQSDGAGVPIARHVSACLANADLPVEQEALEAALHGGYDRVFQALLAHPLVGQADRATALTDRLIQHNRAYLPWV